MTATASPSSAQTASANSQQATRPSSGSATSSKSGQSNPADLFASLLGLISATHDEPSTLALTTTGHDGALAQDPDAETTDTPLITDPSALGLTPPNPLADLIGWPGAPATGGGASAASVTGAAQETAGTSLKGMTVLAQPVVADPPPPVASLASADTALPSKLPTPGSSPGSTPADADADPDAVSVRYGEEGGTPSGDASRNSAYMAARPANWRSTTALASAPSSTQAPANPAGQATTQTTAIQVAQNAAVLRGAVADPSQPSQRHITSSTELTLDTVAESAAGGLGAIGAAGQASSGQHSAAGQDHQEALPTGAMAPEAAEADAPDDAFSLDAALAPSEDPEGAEFMNPHQLRHASVRVGEGTDEAIDIRLSLEGDAVHVDFRTDNAEVRAGLQHNAGGSLSDLMQRGGIQLGGVSVGAQSHSSREQAGQGQSGTRQIGGSGARGPSGARVGGGQDADMRPRAPLARRADGGPSLDVFA